MQRVCAAAAAVLVASLVVSLGGGAAAQVLDIAPDGAVTTLREPAIYTDPDSAPRPIDPHPAEAASPSMVPMSRAALANQLRVSAERHNLSPKMVEAVAWRESRFNPQALSPKGAVGVMQLMPDTARALGVDARDPASNIEGGAAYLERMLKTFDGDLPLALAAYNAGPAAVRQYAGVPPFPETKAFVDAILGRLADTVAVGSAR
jgi:soluble lytic murein transglycosylase-like protein